MTVSDMLDVVYLALGLGGFGALGFYSAFCNKL